MLKRVDDNSLKEEREEDPFKCHKENKKAQSPQMTGHANPVFSDFSYMQN
jgi:hypothetical protein